MKSQNDSFPCYSSGLVSRHVWNPWDGVEKARYEQFYFSLHIATSLFFQNSLQQKINKYYVSNSHSCNHYKI